MTVFPFEAPALQIEQPIGTFYVAILPAHVLLQVAASDVMSAALNDTGVGYSLSGTQRLIQDKRLAQIADYIDRSDSAFPNSIILAANHNREFGLDQDETEEIRDEEAARLPSQTATANSSARPDKAWSVRRAADGCWMLHIPTSDKLAAIIDGQHRLFAFAKADTKTRLDMQLLCAVFLDLPKPFQAQLFATINSTQKPVDRSLTYELFGYNVADESELLWTPDKLAVFLTRKLGTEEGSPLQGRITVAPKRDEALQALTAHAQWKVSTAVVVDGILRLFSSNPKRDANAMRTPEPQPRNVLAQGSKDRSPLREQFIAGNDALVFKLVDNYLRACVTVFWTGARPGSYILKTVGVQALFDILRKVAPAAVEAKNLTVSYFEEKLRPAGTIDFAATEYQVPSGSGRSFIRKAIEERIAI
jgi:DNA phosphorothioation-associated DGQHR protein 1